MRHLFSTEGDQALEAVMRLQPLMAFDFDGTLAPIVARHGEARVSTAVSTRLQQLARLGPVAIVTGRSVADVSPRLGFDPRFIVGNHGAESPDEAGVRTDAALLDPLRARLAGHAAALANAGVEVEDKRYSLALHYRLARDQALAQARIAEALGDPGPQLKLFGGKCVVNVAAAAAPDKGDAVLALMKLAGTRTALFVGDDVNDEAVFVRAEEDWLTVRIGRDAPRSAARFFLDSHSEIATLLQKMLELLREDQPSGRSAVPR
jgi:trehalose 6-phosphate phosphatase